MYKPSDTFTTADESVDAELPSTVAGTSTADNSDASSVEMNIMSLKFWNLKCIFILSLIRQIGKFLTTINLLKSLN